MKLSYITLCFIVKFTYYLELLLYNLHAKLEVTECVRVIRIKFVLNTQRESVREVLHYSSQYKYLSKKVS